MQSNFVLANIVSSVLGSFSKASCLANVSKGEENCLKEEQML